MESTLWTEKYRPDDFSGIIGQSEIVERARGFVRQKNMPHLLLAGPPGVGKTTLALVIAKQLYGENWRANVLELNASSERGIDIIRNNVKDFARTKSIGDVPFKICILDEADSLTREAQQALRRTMENYSATCRFIMLANYSSKIIEPIQSRCAVFRFRPLSREQQLKIVESIAKHEGLDVDEKGKDAIIQVSEGDRVRIEFTSILGFHDWVVDDFNAATERVSEGGSTYVEFVANKKGTFEYYCSVGSHRQAGMRGNLVVE